MTHDSYSFHQSPIMRFYLKHTQNNMTRDKIMWTSLTSTVVVNDRSRCRCYVNSNVHNGRYYFESNVFLRDPSLVKITDL